ncbi:LapA family protein [Sphingorhabdus sp. EL138]|uniref:LapA family protein n=1 Tax=Sphingorhabdus sp. EL138 TaxID=2073156 RepID=UPI000D6972BC|nr:LapA family protein [Sphingorhabdus sp. EL138]
MQFIKTLFWVILAVILVVFAVNNWSPTSVLIWQDIRIDTKLPVLVIGAFLLGFVPMWILHRTSKWRLNRRIKTLEAAARPVPVSSTAASNATKPSPAPTKPAATPLDLGKEQISEPAAVSPITGDDKAAGT